MGFASKLKDHQIKWAASSGKSAFLELKPEWVLVKEKRQENLFDPKWLKLIAQREHRWFRALNSSQAFAVNLFGPAATDKIIGRAIFNKIVPWRSIDLNDEVQVYFEYTPPGSPGWLGEENSRQPTQVDVAFEVHRCSEVIGYLLIEVKLSEGFGTCRGFKHQKKDCGPSSPCNDAISVLANPEANCWMVSKEKRRYWKILSSGHPPLKFESNPATMPCPFRDGRYQLMRNRVLADALVMHGGAGWADFAVCTHPGNDSGGEQAIQSFQYLFGDGAVLHIPPNVLISTVVTAAKGRFDSWAEYMHERYNL